MLDECSGYAPLTVTTKFWFFLVPLCLGGENPLFSEKSLSLFRCNWRVKVEDFAVILG